MKKYSFSLIKGKINFKKISQVLNTDLTSSSSTENEQYPTAAQVNELKKKLPT
ncbi:MAG: hypothetical protein QNJ60_17290 [Xenococcaceae cyanobacterium MO_188.B19]|nr:hypothetical protein [Xenococcaceae cyanobacterium MO_188.B19]